MTDEEVRARLLVLRRGDPVTNWIWVLNCFQLSALYLLSGTGTDFRSICAYVVLAILGGSWIARAVRCGRDDRSGPEDVRRMYEAALGKSIQAMLGMPEALYWVSGGVGLCIGITVLVSPYGDRPLGGAIALLNVLFAVQFIHQKRRVQPRLEREQREFLADAAA